jgi:hypothetical protein
MATNVYKMGDPAPGDTRYAVHVLDGHPDMEGITPDGNGINWDSKPAPTQPAQPVASSAPDANGIIWDTQPASQPVAAPAPQATVSATPGSMPNDPMAAKIANWTNNVSSDLKHGTSITGVGKFLKSLGAHGFDVGVSPQVGEFMGSLPLGLLKAAKGAAEVAQPGQRLQGTKDTIGGLLDAATIPGSFVAPEAGELAASGMGNAGDAIATQAGKAAKAIKAPFTVESIQPALQQGIRDAVNSAAKELGVQPSASASIRDVANEVASAAKTKAHSLYASLDNAVGNTRFQEYQSQLNDALKELRSSISEADPDAHGELVEKVNNLEAAKERAYQTVRDAGMDPDGIFARAQGLWKRASALEDLGSHVEKSTTGMRPELAADASKTNPETVSTTKLFGRANQMYNDRRLAVALGEQKAKELLQAVDAAHLQALKIAAHQKYLKVAGKLALYGGGYEALRHGASHLLSE